MEDFFIAFKMLMRLENEPPFAFFSGVESRLDLPDEESSMFSCCFMYFL
jgi:hypothetical protein